MQTCLGDSLSFHKGSKFSAWNKDYDELPGEHCAQLHKGAWWYGGVSGDCSESNLNGVYRVPPFTDPTNRTGIEWISFHGHGYSMKYTEMKVRPTY